MLTRSVASGESEFTLWACKDLIETRTVDILQADATHCGGITEWRKIAAMCRAYYIPLMPHGGGGGAVEVNAHCAASLSENEVWWVESFRPLDGWGETWLKEPLKVTKDGNIALTEQPGFGIELDEEAIKRHQIPSYLHF